MWHIDLYNQIFCLEPLYFVQHKTVAMTFTLQLLSLSVTRNITNFVRNFTFRTVLKWISLFRNSLIETSLIQTKRLLP